MSSNRYIGDDWIIPVRITKGGTNLNLSGATIKGAVVDAKLTSPLTQLVPTTVMLHNYDGADWANGLVIVVFTSAQTSTITSQKTAYVELQYELNGIKQTLKTFNFSVLEGTIP